MKTMSNPRKVLQNSAREIILRVRAYCEAEKCNGSPIIPLHRVRSRVAAMTGISEKTVSRISKKNDVAESISPKPKTTMPGPKNKKDLKRLQDVKKKNMEPKEIKRLVIQRADKIKGGLQEAPLDPTAVLSIEYTEEEYLEEDLEDENSNNELLQR